MIGDKQRIKPAKTSFKGVAQAPPIVQSASRHALLRVLHIDDDLNQLMFTKIFLEECDPDLIVESVSVPSEAVRALGVENYDCVVSDYQMEEMDGIVLTRRVRELSDIPIIIYTGRGSEEVEAVARAAGANGYVQKGIDPEHYRGLCEQIISAVHAD
jgi:CheY-like chemotaxis protein